MRRSIAWKVGVLPTPELRTHLPRWDRIVVQIQSLNISAKQERGAEQCLTNRPTHFCQSDKQQPSLAAVSPPYGDGRLTEPSASL